MKRSLKLVEIISEPEKRIKIYNYWQDFGVQGTMKRFEIGRHILFEIIKYHEEQLKKESGDDDN